jgi:hypothetical protein
VSGFLFFCWAAYNSESAEAHSVEANSAQDAATKHANRIWSDGDYPTEMEIVVEERLAGKTVKRTTFTVEARQEISFYATEKKAGA